MKAKYVQVEKPGAPLEVVTREVPEPKAGEVRVRVEACGVCHSDSATVAGLFPFIQYPRVPGHEVVGKVDSVGEGVPHGSRVSAWVSAGMADTAAGVNLAGAATWSHARILRFRELLTMAVMPIT